MDRIDKQILALLSKDASRTATDMRETLHLSIPAINKRIKSLKSSGIISRYTVQVDAKLIGKPILAIVLLVVQNYNQVSELFDFIQEQPNIVECYAITGEYDYLIKVYAKDVEDLENTLLTLKEKRCVSKSQTMFVMREHKYLPGPLPD